MSEKKDPWNLEYPFMRQSHDFVLGFEFGGIWESLTTGGPSCGYFTCHEENKAEVLRAIAHHGLKPENVQTEDGWTHIEVEAR